MSINLTLSVILVLTLLSATNAQRSRSKARSSNPTPPKTEKPEVNVRSSTPPPQVGNPRPFDLATAKLPSNFSGHDIKALYNEMSSRFTGAKKDEFETTEEFHARVQRQSMAPVLGGLNKEGVFAFTLTNSSGETIYDADRQVMTVAVALSRASKNVYTESNKKALTSQVEMNTETYEGSNAMGAKVQVTRTIGKNYEVAISNYSDFGMMRYIDSRTRDLGYTSDIHAQDTILIAVPMDIAIAKRVKDHLKVLAVVRLREPYTFEGTFYAKPTFKDPKEYFVEYHYLNSELLELWVYDNTTGQIFVKRKPNE